MDVAQRMAGQLAAPLLHTAITRLLVEPNRSLDHPALFSEFSRSLSSDERQVIVDRYYHPHRAAIESLLSVHMDAGKRALHVGVHSFTDTWEGAKRDVDIGLLFDPARGQEAAMCAHWRRSLESSHSKLRIRFNEPYLGSDDGLTTTLRQRLAKDLYAGIEIEVRQGLLASSGSRRTIADMLGRTLPSAE
jgi:predicted N-formylglutamate amidohydrolase